MDIVVTILHIISIVLPEKKQQKYLPQHSTSPVSVPFDVLVYVLQLCLQDLLSQ